MNEHLLKGRPAALTILDFGLFRVHSTGRIIGICGYLIRTDADEYVLIDGGFPEKYTVDFSAASQEDRLYEFGEVLVCGPEHTATAQLARCGITPEQISLLILTHTHIDHIGAIADFLHAPMVVAAAERALPKPLYWGGVQPIDWPDRTYHLVDADMTLGPDFDLMLVPGHAPGQLAMLLRLPQTGPVILTSDAISRPAELDETFAGSWDEPAAVASGDRLMRCSAERGAFVIYGHCPRQWPDLRKAPLFYA